jgi:hypothetical protein
MALSRIIGPICGFSGVLVAFRDALFPVFINPDLTMSETSHMRSETPVDPAPDNL